MSNTIAAISTPLSTGGISVIRISGNDAIAVAESIFRAKSGEKLANKKGYTASFGAVYDDNRELDTSIATVFRAPKSYTGEDVVELSCHGGIVVTREVLRVVLSKGAVLAQPGEFTKRAFLNGKLDLIQAEAISDIITAKSRQALDAAKSQMDGILCKKIQQIKTILLNLAGHMAAWADYPDEDIPELEEDNLLNVLTDVKDQFYSLLSTFDTGMLLKEGVNTVIVGKPNVGKSTLMNLLAGADKSIVTEIAGTTRDVVEETVNLNGLLLRISDTAGIHETEDRIEKLGVKLAKKTLASAMLILAVFDSSNSLSKDDLSLIDALDGKPVIAVVNKTDLPQNLEISYLKSRFDTVIFISAVDRSSLSTLERAIRGKVHLLDIDTTAPMLVTERQRQCVKKAADAVDEAIGALKAGMTLDAVTISVETAVDALLELFGGKASEEVVNTVFSHFCVGK